MKKQKKITYKSFAEMKAKSKLNGTWTENPEDDINSPDDFLKIRSLELLKKKTRVSL